MKYPLFSLQVSVLSFVLYNYHKLLFFYFYCYTFSHHHCYFYMHVTFQQQDLHSPKTASDFQDNQVSNEQPHFSVDDSNVITERGSKGYVRNRIPSKWQSQNEAQVLDGKLVELLLPTLSAQYSDLHLCEVNKYFYWQVAIITLVSTQKWSIIQHYVLRMVQSTPDVFITWPSYQLFKESTINIST